MPQSSLRLMVEEFLSAVASKDTEGILARFSDDAVFNDPHYPTPRMVGKEAIRDGLQWSFSLISRFGFPISNYFESQDGTSAAIEVATAHVLGDGTPLNFPQVFIVEVRDSLVTRLQSYLPYGPPAATV